MGDVIELPRYLYANFRKMPEIELEFRQYYFWLEVLRYGTSDNSPAIERYQQEKILEDWNDYFKYGAGPINKQQKLTESENQGEIIKTSEVFLKRVKKTKTSE